MILHLGVQAVKLLEPYCFRFLIVFFLLRNAIRNKNRKLHTTKILTIDSKLVHLLTLVKWQILACIGYYYKHIYVFTHILGTVWIGTKLQIII